MAEQIWDWMWEGESLDTIEVFSAEWQHFTIWLGLESQKVLTEYPPSQLAALREHKAWREKLALLECPFDIHIVRGKCRDKSRKGESDGR